MLLGLMLQAGSGVADDKDLTYPLRHEITLKAADASAEASITVVQSRALLKAAAFRAPATMYSDFEGDGQIVRDGDRLTWRPPKSGGTLRYRVKIENRRKSTGYDALIEKDWALFRLEDVFPTARTEHKPGARSRSSLRVKLPKGWIVETPYLERPGKPFLIDNPERRFDRPTGWVVAGKLGVRKDMIAGTEVSVAGPLQMGIQRIGMLALLRWTLPDLADKLDLDMPPRINIVSANDPMWRGGLSGPESLYIHADLPLLSEDASSTLLHEIMHILMPVPAADEHDWIDEGLAEYAALRVLRDTDTISTERFDASIARARRRGESIDDMNTTRTNALINARAVAIFHALDMEIQQHTEGEADLFTLAQDMMQEPDPIDLERLRAMAGALTDSASIEALEPDRVPGFASAN